MSHRSFSAEEAYEFLASDMESASEDDTPFILLSSSSSEEEEEEPPRRHSRTTTKAAPKWTPPPKNYEPQIPKFTGSSGIKFDTSGFRKIDFFKIYFTHDFVDLMVAQTNLYAQRFLTKNPKSKWTPINAAEMVKFWGLLLNLGLLKKPSIKACWSADILYHTLMFRMTMSRTRFEAILKFLHFIDNEQCPPPDDPSYDSLFKIRPLVEHFSAKFAQAYTPEKCISVGESLVHFNGKLQSCLCLPSNRVRYGLKMYKLCESTSGYIHRFKVYEAKGSRTEPAECPPSLGTSGKIVWDLVHPLLDQGYHLYLHHYYTSIPLLKCLAARRTAVCGTVRKKKRLPKALLGQTLNKGESKALRSENVLCVTYKDRRDVHVLTTIHGNDSTASTETPKPVCVQEYDKYMRGPDLSDLVLQPYVASWQSWVWYKSLAVHIVQMALYNAYVLSRCAGHGGTFHEFQEVVIKTLIFGNLKRERPSTSSGSDVSRIVPGQHFPCEVPQTRKKGRSQKRCRVCSKKGIRKETIYQCDTCPVKPGLCMKECFRIYHTSPIFGDQEGEGPSTSTGSKANRIVPGQHFPCEVPQTGKRGRSQKRCRVCSKKGIRKDTIYQCDTCPVKPGLCMKDCFRIYHTAQ
ncbi:piggyBac transposable element-derived protein 4-like [Leptodactylus fuscus]